MSQGLQSLSRGPKPRLLHSVRNDKPAHAHPHVDRRGMISRAAKPRLLRGARNGHNTQKVLLAKIVNM